MNVKIYNTMSRSVERFQPYMPGQVNLYTCGPTVYNYAHIGNLRTYISEDLLEKALVFLGYHVTRCMNVTDVGHLESDGDEGEDKMLKGAARENKTVYQIAEYYTKAFFDDAARLNIKKPQIIVKATDMIDKYIDFIKVLEEKGYTYFKGGNVYFDISKFPNYTDLSKVELDSLKTAVREDVEDDQHKKNPQDFVLWFTKSKFSKQAMKWPSPWGVGYPGWHIECSVIALESLGPKLDIHCGGVDHIAVHHSNEIAQTESYTGEKWTKYWWHAEHLIDVTGKMSKSKGRFLTLSLLIEKGYHPLSYRYYCLGSHYRKQLAFDFAKLDQAQRAYYKLRQQTASLANAFDGQVILSERATRYLTQFKAALADDLNSANAITTLYDVLKSQLPAAQKARLIAMFDEVLSLDLLTPRQAPSGKDIDSAEIEAKIAARNQAKTDKNWSRADAIRDELAAVGIQLKDGPSGTTWHYRE